MGTAVVPFVRDKALTRISATNLPPAITNGLLDVLTAFAAGPQQDDADKKRLLRVYGEAVESFEPALAAHAINWLKLHNPRNPFRPTPQDVYETCAKLVREWRRRVVEFFTAADPTWRQRQDLIAEFPWGTEPLTSGCFIPAAMAKAFLRDYLRSQKPEDLAAYFGRERLSRIPAECFEDGRLEAALSIITETERRRAEKAAHEAYLDTLDPELRSHRRLVLNQDGNHKLGESELLALAQQSLERDRAEAARRASEAEEWRRIMSVNSEPVVRAILERISAAHRRGNWPAYEAAVNDYRMALEERGVKPPPWTDLNTWRDAS